MNRKEILDNIRDEEERLAAAKAIDKMLLANKTYSPEFTVFMDPYKAYMIKDMLLKYDSNIMIYGGYEDAERVKIGFFPEFTEKSYDEFPITAVEIKYNQQYSRKLSHRDFLGSILGLGITREKIGDIITEDGCAVCLCDSDISDYVTVNLERVGHTKVKVKIIEKFKPIIKEPQEKMLTVSGMRLDAVISAAFNISRGRASEFVKNEKAFINWKNETSASHIVKEGDFITLRGVGRIKINEIVGITKKERTLINVSVFK